MTGIVKGNPPGGSAGYPSKGEMQALYGVVSKAPGRRALCWSPGNLKLPLALAKLGMLVVCLEDDPGNAGKLMELAKGCSVLSNLQIFLQTAPEALRDSIDYYHLIAVGSGEFQRLDLKKAVERLEEGGILAVFDVERENSGLLAKALSASGLSGIECRYAAPLGILGSLASLFGRQNSAMSISGVRQQG